MNIDEISITFIGDRWLAEYKAFKMTADPSGETMLSFNGNEREEHYESIRRTLRQAINAHIASNRAVTLANQAKVRASLPPFTVTITGPFAPVPQQLQKALAPLNVGFWVGAGDSDLSWSLRCQTGIVESNRRLASAYRNDLVDRAAQLLRDAGYIVTRPETIYTLAVAYATVAEVAPPMNASTLAWALRDGMQDDVWYDADDDSTVYKQIEALQANIERAATILDTHDALLTALRDLDACNMFDPNPSETDELAKAKVAALTALYAAKEQL